MCRVTNGVSIDERSSNGSRKKSEEAPAHTTNSTRMGHRRPGFGLSASITGSIPRSTWSRCNAAELRMESLRASYFQKKMSAGSISVNYLTNTKRRLERPIVIQAHMEYCTYGVQYLIAAKFFHVVYVGERGDGGPIAMAHSEVPPLIVLLCA